MPDSQEMLSVLSSARIDPPTDADVLRQGLAALGVERVFAGWAPILRRTAGTPSWDVWFVCDLGLAYCTISTGRLTIDVTAWRDVRDVELRGEVGFLAAPRLVDSFTNYHVRLVVQLPRLVAEGNAGPDDPLVPFARELLLHYQPGR